MGRELRRKQAKKEGKSLKREISNETNQVKSLIIIIIILVVIVGLIYLLSALFVTKELDWFGEDDNKSESLIDKTILASEAFEQKETDYYVYFYDYTNEDSDITSSVNAIKDLNVYKVDTNSGFNKNYVSSESNRNAKTLEELKVNGNTLIKISGGTISAYYENEEIKNMEK